MTFEEKILEVAEEGCVLLRNEENALPLKSGEKISIFGRYQFDYYKCGLGSGGSVHAPYITNIASELMKMEKAGGPKLNSTLMKKYADFIQHNPFDNGGGAWAAEPYFQKDIDLDESTVDQAAQFSQKAIFVIGRNAGEDKDLKAEKGGWYLNEQEEKNLELICSRFSCVILVFNTCGIIGTSFIYDEKFGGKIKAVLYGWQGGQEGGKAIARILCGTTNPSGKLSATIARDIGDYPSTPGFGEIDQCIYHEDIYTGYRYFSTFARDKVLFPFGFGLSYTDFSCTLLESSYNGTVVTVKCSVKNEGSEYAGKEVIQIYVESPQGKLGKPVRVLAAFAKTKKLRCGESQVLTMTFDMLDLASYDDSGVTGNKSCWVLEEGKYYVYLGTSVESAKKIPISERESIEFIKTAVVKKCTQALSPETSFERLRPGKLLQDGTYSFATEMTPKLTYSLEERIRKNMPKEIPYTGNKGIKFNDVKNDHSKLNDFIAQLTPEELATLVRGEGMMSQKTTAGIASAFGGVSEALYSYGIPVAGCTDGPSGIRLDTGKEASLMPTGTVIACTWNKDLTRELMEFEGSELNSHQIDTLLGPGINIQRNPLNGRNFEYFSEDPLLTASLVIEELRGLYKHGIYATIKHFAANSQETDRRKHNSIVSERALREIYLKVFELAVAQKEITQSIMTSYNRINGHWAASNFDLDNTILRQEWGYTGLVMTDWWASMNDCTEGGEGSIENVASMVRAQNDVYMVVPNDKAEISGNGDNIAEALAEGKLTIAELQECARHVIMFLTKALVSKRKLRSLKEFKSFISQGLTPPNGEKVYQENFKMMCGKKESGWLYIAEKGMYNVLGMYSKENDGTMSQSVCNILIDGEPAAAFECRSTDGKHIGANATQVQLEKGFYKIELNHIKPGIEIDYIGFSRRISNSSGITRLVDEDSEESMKSTSPLD